MQTVEFIKTNQAAGMALDAIKAALPGFYLEQANKAKAHVAFLKEWLDVDKAKVELADLFDCDLSGADIMLTETARCWVVSIDGQTVTLAEVERINHVIVDYVVVLLEDYIAWEAAEIRMWASKGIVRGDLGNLAHRVFSKGWDFKEMVTKAKSINKLVGKMYDSEVN